MHKAFLPLFVFTEESMLNTALKILVLGLLMFCAAFGQGDGKTAVTKSMEPGDMTSILNDLRKEYGLPAIAAAVVRTDGKIDKAAVGVRIAGKDVQVTLSDRFHLGSVSKSMTATMIAAL